MVICSEIIKLPDGRVIAKMFGPSGDVFYVVDSPSPLDSSSGESGELITLIAPDTDEVIALTFDNTTSNTCGVVYPKHVIQDLKKATSEELIFRGGKVLQLKESEVYTIPEQEFPQMLPAVIVEFDKFKGCGQEFLGALPYTNVVLFDTLCRLFYLGLHQSEKIPKQLSCTLDEFMGKHSVTIKRLIDEQQCDIKCTDPFKRRQRKCKIDFLANLMLEVYWRMAKIGEIYSELKELDDQVPYPPDIDITSDMELGSVCDE